MILEAVDLGALKAELAKFLRTSGKISGIDGAGHTLLRYDRYFEHIANRRNEHPDDTDAVAEEKPVDAAELILDRLMSIDPSPSKGFMRWLIKMFDAGYISFDEGPFAGINRYDPGLSKKTQLHLPEDYGDLTRGLRELGKTTKDKALYAELGLSTDIQQYKDVASVIAVPQMLAGKKQIKIEGENAPPWVKVIENQMGCVKVLDRGEYIIMMTPKNSIASKYGFPTEVRLDVPLPPKGLNTGNNIRRFQPGCTYDAIGVLGGFGEESGWCTRYGIPEGSIPGNYLPGGSIFTVFKKTKASHPTQFMQMVFGGSVQIMNLRNQPVRIENIEEPLRQYLVEVLSKCIEPLPENYAKLTPEEKQSLNKGNEEFRKGFLMMLTPEYMLKNPAINAIYMALMGPGRATLKGAREQLRRPYFKMFKDEIKGILAESGINPRDQNCHEKLIKAAVGTSVGNLLPILYKNPIIMCEREITEPSNTDPFMFPPEMMFNIYDQNPFNITQEKLDSYLGMLANTVYDMPVKNLINKDEFYKPYLDIIMNHPNENIGSAFRQDVDRERQAPI